jgi:hypothetical protein
MSKTSKGRSELQGMKVLQTVFNESDASFTTLLQAQIDALEDDVNDLQTHSQTFTTATWTGSGQDNIQF